MICDYCGEEIDDDNTFCPRCGTELFFWQLAGLPLFG